MQSTWSSQNILRNIANIPGWRSRFPIVVFESDDWGSIRMPSNGVFKSLMASGIDLLSDDGSRFNKFDSLATAEDISSLFEVLSSIKDITGRAAVFTPASVVANPDFSRIKESGFTEYHYESFVETLKRYPGCENSFNLWLEGIKERLFVPQFHGREHLNVSVWMRALGDGHKKSMVAFNNHMWGISTSKDPEIKVEFQAAFDFINPIDLKKHEEIIVSGLSLFEELFGYKARYFVPPNGHFSYNLEGVIVKSGVRFLSTYKFHLEPIGAGRKKRHLHWLGQKSKSGIVYMTRNCFFEPSQSGKDWIDSCLKDIEVAFRWGKPAIISTHRVNYIGALDKRNRDNGLFNLETLLKRIKKKWQNVVFLTTEELGNIMCR